VAIQDVSFEVGKGEIFAFLGPNGAGKTTTLKMLTRRVAGQTNLLRHHKQLFSSAITFGYNPKRPISLVVEYDPEAERAQLELARIGYDQIAGFPVAENLKETL